MTTDPLERLRGADPAADGGSAPPLAWILERIATEQAKVPHRRRRWTRAIVPALGAMTAIAVVVLAFLLVHGKSSPVGRLGQAASPRSTARDTSSAPVGGMRGVVEVSGVALSSPEDEVISFTQCWPCHAAPHGGRQSNQDWLAATENGGHSWRVTAEPWVVSRPHFDATGDGWAQGVSNSHGAQGVAGFYVSHDNGRSWTVAPSASPSPGLGPTSIAGGEVWAMGESCQPTCKVTVLHGAASGSRLTAAAAQPVSGDANNLQVVAGGGGVAYVTNPDSPHQSFVTHNDGRSWQPFSDPCPGSESGTGLAIGGSVSMWDTCQQASAPAVLRRSVDGGRHWTSYPLPSGDLITIQPVAAQIAWALTVKGQVLRTTDGGRSWSAVWKVTGSQPSALAGHSPMLAAQSTTSATVLVSLTNGHVGKQAKFTNFISYRTSDGGGSWRTSVVRLPAS